MRRGRLLLLAALVVGAVVACSDPRAGTLPPATSASPTTPATATATPVSYAADLRTALQTYFDTLYAAGMDPANKTDDLAALIHPTCTCRRVLDVLRKQARDGRYVDYRYTLSDAKVIDVDGRSGTIRYTVNQSAGALRSTSGRAVESYPASIENYSASFVRADGRWLVSRLDAYR